MDYTALSRFSYGMYILTVKDGDTNNAMLLSVASQVASEPPIFVVSISKSNYSHEMIEKSKIFNISVVTDSADIGFLGKFGFNSGREMDKLEGVKCVTGQNGVPAITENCSAYVECEVIDSKDFEDNTVFFAKYTNLVILGPSKPMTLSHYLSELNGTVSKKAPLYSARYMLAQ